MAWKRFTDEEIRSVHKWWRQGETQHEIARRLDRTAAGVRAVLNRTGGYDRPQVQRSARHLTPEDRESISRGLAAEKTLRQIGRELGRPASTISREVKRNGGVDRYRAASAETNAVARAKRPKPCRLALHPPLRMMVVAKLQQDWSPQQISGWLKHMYPDDRDMHVSHETIYKSLYVQARGVLKRELTSHLRTRRTIRRSSKSSKRGHGGGQIVDAVNISQRPAEVADRAVPGHWEGDLIEGSRGTYVATLVERRSRYVMLVKVPNKEACSVAAALAKVIKRLPDEQRRSLTWDRGTEMAHHTTLRLESKIDIYFCDPNSPWQRGSNENTNGLLRQYFPKGTDLSVHSQAHLNAVARRLNERPRMTLGFRTPSEVFFETLR
jgi:IS30 family transposase